MTFDQYALACDLNCRKHMLYFEACLLEYDMKIAELEETGMLTESAQDELAYLCEGAADAVNNVLSSIANFIKKIFGQIKDAGGQAQLSKDYKELRSRYESGQFDSEATINSYPPSVVKKLEATATEIMSKCTPYIIRGEPIPNELKAELEAAEALLKSLKMEPLKVFESYTVGDQTEKPLVEAISSSADTLVQDCSDRANKAQDAIEQIRDAIASKYSKTISQAEKMNNPTKAKDVAKFDQRADDIAKKTGESFAAKAEGRKDPKGKDLPTLVQDERKKAQKEVTRLTDERSKAETAVQEAERKNTEAEAHGNDGQRRVAAEELSDARDNLNEIEEKLSRFRDRANNYSEDDARREYFTQSALSAKRDNVDTKFSGATSSNREVLRAAYDDLIEFYREYALIEGYVALTMTKGIKNLALAKETYLKSMGVTKDDPRRKMLNDNATEALLKAQKKKDRLEGAVKKAEKRAQKSADGGFTMNDITRGRRIGRVTRSGQPSIIDNVRNTARRIGRNINRAIRDRGDNI